MCCTAWPKVANCEWMRKQSECHENELRCHNTKFLRITDMIIPLWLQIIAIIGGIRTQRVSCTWPETDSNIFDLISFFKNSIIVCVNPFAAIVGTVDAVTTTITAAAAAIASPNDKMNQKTIFFSLFTQLTHSIHFSSVNFIIFYYCSNCIENQLLQLCFESDTDEQYEMNHRFWLGKLHKWSTTPSAKILRVILQQ